MRTSEALIMEVFLGIAMATTGATTKILTLLVELCIVQMEAVLVMLIRLLTLALLSISNLKKYIENQALLFRIGI